MTWKFIIVYDNFLASSTLLRLFIRFADCVNAYLSVHVIHLTRATIMFSFSFNFSLFCFHHTKKENNRVIIYNPTNSFVPLILFVIIPFVTDFPHFLIQLIFPSSVKVLFVLEVNNFESLTR